MLFFFFKEGKLCLESRQPVKYSAVILCYRVYIYKVIAPAKDITLQIPTVRLKRGRSDNAAHNAGLFEVAGAVNIHDIVSG